MAKVTAPLLSLGARGTIGKAQTYSVWKGIPYVRQRVVPANPKSAGQVATRGTFSWCHDAYKLGGSQFQDPWKLYVKGQPMGPGNAFGQANIPVLRSQTNLARLIFTKAAKGGVSLAAIALTAGAGQITANLTLPPMPSGWTLTGAVVMWIKDQSPAVETESPQIFSHALTTPFTSYVITGLTASQEYWVGAYPIMTNAAGETVYGASLKDHATPT